MKGPEPYGYRTDPQVPDFPDDRPIVIFDGMCVLCSGFARFLMRADRAGRFRLLSAQSPLGVALYRHFGLDPSDYVTYILLDQGRAWVKSDGTIGIFQRLGFPWSLLSAARLVPPRARDRLYDLIARNRLKWFGRRDTCFVPQPEQRERFLA